MNKDRILEILESAKDKNDDVPMNLVRKAFEKLPSTQPEQTTEIQDILKYLDEKLHPIVSPDNWHIYSELHDMISELSAESDAPDRNVGDMISRQVAIDAVEKWEETRTWDTWCNEHKDEAEKYHIISPSDVIRELPSEEPEIIRCKDCREFRRWIDTDITFCDLTESERDALDFCSRAERRQDG